MEDRKKAGVLLMGSVIRRGPTHVARKRVGYHPRPEDLLRFADRRFAWTTASRRSSAGCLYDTKTIFEDQLEAVERTSRHQMGTEYTNLALLTDGLRAEREQGITIDVAYRYFATPAQVHHRRHPRPHPVHPQHGHRRLDRRRWPSC